MTALENVTLPMIFAGAKADEARERGVDILTKVGLGDRLKHKPGRMSGGQQQRVALARSLVTEPRILLLDEPLSALDANLVVRMQGVLTRLQRELGITFVYVTHRQSEAFAMSDRVVIMNEGRIEQLDSPRGIYRSPATRFVAEFVGSNNILPGTVTTVGETVELETDTGRFQCIPGEGQHCTVGSPASLVVSADLIRLTTAPSGQPNEIECRFISEEFVGSVVTLLTETAAGDDFKIQINQRELSQLDLRPGAALYAHWDLPDAHLLLENS